MNNEIGRQPDQRTSRRKRLVSLLLVLPASLVIYDYVRYLCGGPIEPIEMATMVIRLSIAKLVILILLHIRGS
ncbi:hypothetical protein M5W83_16670 [Paenibacillus thiaminolyticus]|uniref:Uncharacterized protein n=2 Tax=Paenibacillus thiaminolyticus TaxID=49283 RepID=A0AAP9DRG7_PANTH|nr:hypothetical protein [Paenibacillus thiaminolyticus]MCY9535958.1 hypothetical protein [Paenibacillus thiaminolyticus]MCY9602381.1 hypothetical protein [Paenibacillus thiaminolyticus]MCY9608776.1 hypothetical protein [Paenibacillus thiaminolyticus]MCY9613523.1 hypothetical protein [Paenibacillus thiaminolyticus]MCY9620341.1 hypothetical protein [Paenibacillus thiaminolyticus]